MIYLLNNIISNVICVALTQPYIRIVGLMPLNDDHAPSKHDTLNQCWVNVGPPSSTLAQH